jgi:hypothetical protein
MAWQKKKMTPTPLSARLLAKEAIEILDGACQPCPRVVTRHDIEHDVTALLRRGLTTTSAGGFFFIPYLLQLGAYALASTLGPTKHKGLPKERLALGLVFESIFGYTAGIRTVDTVSRADFGLLAGLPFLPSPSTQYRFLQDVSVQDGLTFQTALGRRLLTLGQITPGHPINVDGHNMKTYSRKAMSTPSSHKRTATARPSVPSTPKTRRQKSPSSLWPPTPGRPSRRSPAAWPL